MTEVGADNGGIAINNSGKGIVNVSVGSQLAHMPSVLTPLLTKIIEHHKPKYQPNLILEKSPKIEDKIQFNNLIYFSDDVRNNSEFMSIVEEALAVVDDQDPGAKAAIQWTIHRSYKETKRELLMGSKIKLSDVDAVRNLISDNSDLIFKKAMDDLFCIDLNTLECAREHLIAAKELLICYGFISCMILEEPI